jgi:hypothetical protein
VPSLLLHPEDAYWTPDPGDKLTPLLDELGLIAAETDVCAATEFYAGPRFLNLIMFLGCSPRVVLDPREVREGETVCGVRYRLYPEVSFVSADTPPRPRCPVCRASVSQLEPVAYNRCLQCARCGEVRQMSALDWRRAAGFGRFFLDVGGIYPHEAVPADKLLEGLHRHTGCTWRYFYAG